MRNHSLSPEIIVNHFPNLLEGHPIHTICTATKSELRGSAEDPHTTQPTVIVHFDTALLSTAHHLIVASTFFLAGIVLAGALYFKAFLHHVNI